jgi:hypothetical protein
MIQRDEALNKAKQLQAKPDSMAAYIRELIVRGYFDSPLPSRTVVKDIKDLFGRKFPVSYVQTYMKQFLQAGLLRAKDDARGPGNVWVGAWVPEDESSQRRRGDRLRLKLDTTGWDPEVAEDFRLSRSCYSDRLWKPAAVMCRRAYEGALILKFRTIEGTEPEKQGTCPKCSTKLGIRPLSITDLHLWAVRNHFVREKMDGLSVLLKDIGAGGAHRTKSVVVDENTAEIIIKCGAVLLQDLHAPQASSAAQPLTTAATPIPPACGGTPYDT